MKIRPEQIENHCICRCQGECREMMEWWSLAANLWERHQLSEKVNGAESATGEAGEEEEWRYGWVIFVAATCGHRRFRLFTQALADLSLLRKQRR